MIAETVFVLAGIGAGLLYAFSGFSDVKQTQTLDKNPRVQNLKYAASVLPTAIIADVGKLGAATSSIPLTAYYVAATIVAALFSIGGIALYFAHSLKSLAKADERYRAVQHNDLVMTYLHWGFAAYREAKERV